MTSRFIALMLLLVSTTLHAQWVDWRSPSVPRTPDSRVDAGAPAPRAADGNVDMSGEWVPADISGSLFDLSKIQAWALDAMHGHEQTFHTEDPRFHCLPAGPGAYAALGAIGRRRLLQHPDFIAILNPDMTYRQVFMDGRTLEDEPLLSTWMGYSTGNWDGDTLVIESNGYNDKTWLTGEGLPHTSQLRITERYNRVDYGHMMLEVTYEDAGTFTEPVQATIALLNQPDSPVLEEICNESETGRQHYSGEITQAEQKVVQVPLAVLQQYIGTYQGLWGTLQVTVDITVENGNLMLTRTPRYPRSGSSGPSKSRLLPQSATAFECTCGLGFIFTVGANGVATEISEVHVSGAWPFKRVR